ncbi:hypothetical protein [Luteithermobacter gelatinilyticus]|uniref:hypothetical protein n=1 Tax=Luteithermobacter gelatinilyticus TaxID=2582913 RepID=UPI001AF00B53|nr:hypothetical protein [Luteithermobacter gelatinilyticus]
MKHFIQNFENLERYKKAARAHAIENLDWFKNSKVIPDLVRSCKFRAANEDLIRKAFVYDDRTLPMFSKFKLIYRLAYKFLKK